MPLKMLRRTLTITLDFDWIYRRLIPAIWTVILLPALRTLSPVHRGRTEGLPRAAVTLLGPARDEVAAERTARFGVAPAVVALAAFLFLALNLFDPPPPP